MSDNFEEGGNVTTLDSVVHVASSTPFPEGTVQIASSQPKENYKFTQADMDQAVQEGIAKALAERGIGDGIPEGGVLAFCSATPTLGILSAWWHAHEKQLIFPMNTSRIPLMPIDKSGGKIAEMRNGIVKACIEMEQGKHDTGGRPVKVHSIFWLDDDVVVNKWAIQSLLEHNRPIAAGVYFVKTETHCEPLIFPGGSAGTTPFRAGKCFESWGWAQGLSLVNLDVYKHMLKEMGEEMGLDDFGNPAWYRTPGVSVNEKNGAVTVGGTEDFPFFGRANRLGYRCMVDCRPAAFGWHYDAKTKTGFPKKQWEQYKDGKAIIWPGVDGEPDVVWGAT